MYPELHEVFLNAIEFIKEIRHKALNSRIFETLREEMGSEYTPLHHAEVRWLSRDAEPLPRIDSLPDKLNSAKYFSMLDLTSGYWHIPLHDKDKEKLAFITTEGYEIKEGCITPDNQNIETIKKLQPPKNVKQLQSFLGSVNVSNKFIDSYAKIREPLNQLLKKNKQWDWTAECQTAFELLKNKLITKPVLQFYGPKLPLHVFCDASLNATGAILKQPDNSGTLHSVSYHSRSLRDYEKNY
ncbi:transposon Tf2-9 polyprotein [Trichonephila clavipes]|nr:transposon Tf2-9 polyprotein [Trichonephila clavipes]